MLSTLFIAGWIVLAIVVGIGAHARGRSGIGFFLLSLILSPLIAGFLVLAFPAKARESFTSKLFGPARGNAGLRIAIVLAATIAALITAVSYHHSQAPTAQSNNAVSPP